MKKWIYDTENKTIKECEENSKEIKLTPMECKLIDSLLGNEVVAWKEIIRRIYGDESKRRTAVNNIRDGLFEKEYIAIVNIRGVRT